MRILMLCTKFTHSDGSLWLPSELALELVRRGHNVTVLNLEWSGLDVKINQCLNENPGLEVVYHSAVRLNFPLVSVAVRWFVSSLKLIPFLLRKLFLGKSYDMVVGFSPCTAMYAAIPFARLISRDSRLIYWDFFPIHNNEISKKIPQIMMPLLKAVERRLILSFSKVGCMSQAGISFFASYFGGSGPNLFILPIWTSFIDSAPTERGASKMDYFNNEAAIVFVFGGQLVEGRGIVEVCEAILQAKKRNSNICFLVCGEGALSSNVKFYERENSEAIKFLGSINRDRYRKVLMNSHVGVVSTVSNVNAPTFPSKSLDYMACALPILAATETAGDFGRTVEVHNIGLHCEAGDIEAMADAMVILSNNIEMRKLMGENGKKYLQSHHSVARSADLLLE